MANDVSLQLVYNNKCNSSVTLLSTDNGNKSLGYTVKQKMRSCRITYVVYCPLKRKRQHMHNPMKLSLGRETWTKI